MHIAIGGGDKNKVTTLSHTVSCEEGGRWSRGKLYAAHVIKKLACEGREFSSNKFKKF